MRAHFVNENIGGHVTMHLSIRRALERMDVDASFFDVPPPRLARRLFEAPIPGLAHADLDLHPLRVQLGKSLIVRRHLHELDPSVEVLHAYTHNTILLSSDVLGSLPSVVSLDSTNEQNAYRLPQRHPTRFTPAALRLTKYFERRVYDAATIVVAQSRWGAASVAEYGVDAERIRVVNFGLDIPDATHIGSDGLPRLVFVGRSLERKGGLQLVDLWRRHLRGRARLTLVTPEYVPEEDGLEVVRDVRPGDGRLVRILAESDIFVFPTKMDSFPYVTIEAMAAGLPVVANRTAAVPEIVDDGQTGILVDVDERGSLLAAIERLLKDPSLREAMGFAGRERAVRLFDARTTTGQLVDILKEAVARGPRRSTCASR